MDEEYEERVLSILKGGEGWNDEYSEISEFKHQLRVEDGGVVTEEKLRNGWVLWNANENDEAAAELKIKTLLKHIASDRWFGYYYYLVQFWAVKGEGMGQHPYLTSSNQPFCVGDLRKGLCWYRNLCMEAGACRDEQLGGVGRAYQNKNPESSPDLLHYSIHEFPLRDHAARCGFRGYMALPLFDFHTNHCYGVLELLCGCTTMRGSLLSSLNRGLQTAMLRSTHTNFVPISRYMAGVKPEKAKSDITKILELTIKAVPRLFLAQVWVPCNKCSDMNTDTCCMKRASFVSAHDVDDDMFDYLQACEFHNQQVDLSGLSCSNHPCDHSISKNPLAHYAEKARLSLRFIVCLKREDADHCSNDLYVIEFFLQPKCREDARGDSSRGLILMILDMKLKRFKIVSPGGEVASSRLQANATECESIDMLEVMMNSHMERLSEKNLVEHLEAVDLCCHRPSSWEGNEGWVFCRKTGGGISLPVKEKIEFLMKKIASKFRTYQHKINYYWIVQFWAARMVEDRWYLETWDQPYALGCLARGLASFRKKCMQHRYYIDSEAREDELGPPGRVFKNGYPEITPDLFLYSTKDFSMRNHAVHSCLGEYFAIPMYEKHKHKCVGVLEFVGFGYSENGNMGRALEEAKLRSTHHFHQFRPRFIAHAKTASRKEALTEVKGAFSLMIEIPQLHMAKLWLPYGKCANNVSCMELDSSVMDLICSDMPNKLPQVHQIYVQPRKGIIGMVLASKTKSCFCRNLYEFSIADQPLAHYERRERRGVCFAICLQSSHTGDLLYVLEFYLYRGPATYEYLRSFLNFLLPIMKLELKTFRIASGKQFGDELVVDVVEFSEADRLPPSEESSNLSDVLPVTFKSVKYGPKEHQCTQVQQEQCGVAASNFNEMLRGKRKTGIHLSLDILKPKFGKKLNDVAQELGVGRSTIKRACREYGIARWPSKEKHTRNPSLFKSSNNLRLSEAEKVTMKVRYEEDVIRFELCVSSGLQKLQEEVGMRLNLETSNLKLKYLDEDNDEILLACDADLQLCPKSKTKVGKTCIQLFAQLISK